ncbi:DUF4240 domain-containing protein [Micromonospora chaiyaphumensis]|uniref:DUF4240 domain-containing protein n=1 Tax=Micromonospora chaiyaphumensis TaxID=307119 RepID=A0A1C4W374_9ACTN|nr:DUF4240 domain-containing protein [Micromonospora chaiyaphumensis]SCE90501.1 Protein of unknown function [Micromonospora chaiyaphumensis]
MSVDEFWNLVAKARESAADPSDAEDVAERTLRLLTALPANRIADLAQPLWDLRTQSYGWGLWQAAYLINGGCSDDGFEYFRGWLLTQGRETFERAVADPDTLADLPVVQRVAVDGGFDLECESMYGVVWDAWTVVTGSVELPNAVTGRYPDLGRGWDFEDEDEARRRLPRLAVLFMDE